MRVKVYAPDDPYLVLQQPVVYNTMSVGDVLKRPRPGNIPIRMWGVTSKLYSPLGYVSMHFLAMLLCTSMLPASGVLESPDDFEASEDVYDAVGGVLLECVESDEYEVKVKPCMLC